MSSRQPLLGIIFLTLFLLYHKGIQATRNDGPIVYSNLHVKRHEFAPPASHIGRKDDEILTLPV